MTAPVGGGGGGGGVNPKRRLNFYDHNNTYIHHKC